MPTKYPPALSVTEAISVIEKAYKAHQTTEIAFDLMPEILDVKPSSSNFPACISALQKFGLIRRLNKDMLELTDLAMQIIKPVGDERSQGVIAIFEKTEVLSELYQKFGRTSLPSPEQLKQSLMKNFGVQRELLDKWYDFVAQSFKSLSLVERKQEQRDVKIAVKSEQLFGGEALQLFKIPVPSGRAFEFKMDKEYTSDDIHYIIAFFELMAEGKDKGEDKKK